MSQFTPEAALAIREACENNLAAISQSLNACFQTSFQLTSGVPVNGAQAVLDNAPAQPGVMILISTAAHSIAFLVPETLQLPKWYRDADEIQASLLQTLANEWAALVLPPDTPAIRCASIACGHLKQQLLACGVAEDAHSFGLVVGSTSGQSHATIQVVGPLTTPRFQAVGDWPEDVEVDSPDYAVDWAAKEVQTPRTPPAQSAQARRRRVLPLPVKLVVRIAEKKIDIRQIRTLAPGTLLTFDKSCEDLLDVYIENKLHARGEAVKLGEHFAIKINDENVRTERRTPVFHMS